MFEILESILKQKGITIYRLAKDTGISTTSFYEWKKGKYTPKQDKLQMIADYLDVTVDFLSGKKEINENVSTLIPILGYVPCGEPIEAVEDIVGYANVSPSITKNYFGLYAKGNSMFPKIEEGDLLIVKLCQSVDSGKIAIVKVNGDEATCKKVIYNQNSVTLLPLNNSYDPITYSLDEVSEMPVTIIGEVKEIRRSL